eukprot:TRINITY_DN3879_c0_g1_i3.p1 TRINITY_DN3879_c0_g1~~TRINITY_DN3879_c0_g1_i3.p1  ORF type:complete len:570 (+),score=120.18 TRINITY_DN3879_c0_g1_i3:66-1712(+)
MLRSLVGSEMCIRDRYMIMLRVFLKVAQVVVQSRVDVSHMLTGNEKKSNWFNLELMELQAIDNQVASVLGANKDRTAKLETPIRIDIYKEAPPKANDTRLSRVLLERWSMSLVQSSRSDSSMIDSLQAGYKKLVILLRSVYMQSRQLPVWGMRQASQEFGQQLKYDISVVESVTSAEPGMAEFQFGSQHTPFGRLYLSVRYRVSSHHSVGGEAVPGGFSPDMIESEYFNESLKLVRDVSAPIPIGKATQTNISRQRSFSCPTQAPINEQGPDLLYSEESGEDPVMTQDPTMTSPMIVGSYEPGSKFQPHSLPPRLPTSRQTSHSLSSSIMGPALSDEGVARPMDIPVDKLRHVSSRSSLEDPMGSSRGASPSSFGSSFGSSPYNVFGFTPPFAGATAAPIHTASPPDTESPSESYPLVFGDTRGKKPDSSPTVPISAFKVFDQNESVIADNCESSGNAYSVFLEQQQQEFESEHLPFADPDGPGDQDSKIGSFVEECWHAPALQVFSLQNGQRMSQSTQSLQQELFKLRDTKDLILSNKSFSEPGNQN